MGFLAFSSGRTFLNTRIGHEEPLELPEPFVTMTSDTSERSGSASPDPREQAKKGMQSRAREPLAGLVSAGSAEISELE